jgi:hypothetical protein
MTTYESAPATRKLAAHCICCGRPLLDSVSVEFGIGPVCRVKHGFNESIGEDARKRANVLVHEGACIGDSDPARVLAIVDEIEKLGLAKLAAIVRKRFIDISVLDMEGDKIEVRTPYSEAFTVSLRRRVPYAAKRPVRGTNGKFSHWEIAAACKRSVLGVLADAFPGKMALGSKGAFRIPTVEEFNAKFSATRPVAE